MTQNQNNPVSRRIILLATDRSHSIIGEIVDGKNKTIAYSAYGEQSAQQGIETRLGFNGQLREGNIGWYLLGNGYRAYNPRLMRFHSPDSWSPFGEGGLNSYAYCSNEPINSEDSTGHARLKILPIRSLPQRPTVIVKNPIALQPKRTSVIVENPNSSTSITKTDPERTLTQPKVQNPVAAPIAAYKPPPSIINSSGADIATPSIPISQPMNNTAYSQASKPQEMPRLKSMMDIYRQPLPRGKRNMPRLSISATTAEIKEIPWLNPVVLVVRSS